MKKALWAFLCAAIFLSEALADKVSDAKEQTSNNLIIKNAQNALASGNYEKAFSGYYDAAVHDNNALAQFSLGLFYRNGWGRETNPVVACQWFEKAAQKGIPTAQHLVGVCFEQGTHHPEDPIAAANWFQKAAQAGHIHSYCHLANLLMTGTGFPKDPAKALELCRPAAQQGSIPAQIWMGKFYLQGDSAIRDKQEAYRWFAAAAQKQAPEAFYYLGLILQSDLPARHAPKEIRQLFEQAAALKYVPAYFQAGKHFFHAEPDPETNQLSAEHLAKAYLWLSATIQRSEDMEEITAAKMILEQILVVMPQTWLAELDQKVAQHLQEN
ncbi:tetratricopeptide repeat protein [Nitrosomonas supralitoralis]|uniref:Sel1 repeat family protein n=1 Tax=Nitrosomonas supralitoralis TaxID=2116706 RepID=A0A2P7NZJ8_9PROT|nr:tetratricopeptide repeat protein [Nitrosomonas supralitoralis]PSJ18891.1 sel1 repeat family protein [Nitrosomonas supralitoralis]